MTSLASQHALDLADAGRSPVRAVGRKAHALGVLMAAGIEVPPGVVLTSPWVERASAEELRAELTNVRERLDGPLAVRSSAIDEDTGDRSFAGLYETVLGVDDVDDLVGAVRHVVASGSSERISAYGEAGPGIAVLVQRMVPAEAAGVAFTADPVTGERDVTVVSSVSGIGERLVSGEADPDEWEVRDGEVSARRTPEGSLTDDRVVDVAALAARVADHFGSPQDIEWAFDGERLLLLQSRPITGLPAVAPIEPTIEPPDDGYWMLDQSHYPAPMSPMAASFYLPALESGATEAFRDWGLLLDRLENRVIGWRVYGKLVPLGGGGGPTPPWWLMGILARIVPPIRKQAAKAREALEGGRAERVVERWWDEWRPEFSAEIRRLSEVSLGGLDDEALRAHLDETIEFVEHGQRVHFELFPPYMVSVAETIRFCETELGWSRAKATELLGGLSEMSSAPARRLRQVAEIARERAADVIEADDLTLDDLRDADPELREAIDDYLDEFGVRATAYDVIAPTIGEQEQLIVSAIRTEADYDPDQVEARHARAREEAIDDAHRALADDAAARSRFDELMSAVERAYPVREDNIFFTDNAPLGLVRLAALEIGRRLAARKLIDEPEHVFFLTVDEARASLSDDSDFRDRIHRRRGEREWALRHTPPPSFGTDPGPPPDMRAMPDAVRRVMEAIGFFMEHDLSAETGDGLSGTPVSAGSYTGTARVILTEADFGRVRTGDVLVCPITTPAWSVLFGRIGALVTDTGGLLSHSAIVAREHGIPAVVGTGSATTLIEDGTTVTVDGTSGTVEISD